MHLSPADIKFSNARLADLPFIVAVYNQTIASRMVTADTTAISVDSRLDWFYSHTPQTRPLWLINYQQQPCGWISLSTFYGRPAYAKTVELSVYIDAHFRGQKIGQYAVTAMELYAQEQQITTILGYIFAHNAPSLALFAKLGYCQWGYLPKVAELDRVGRDLVIVGKSIN